MDLSAERRRAAHRRIATRYVLIDWFPNSLDLFPIDVLLAAPKQIVSALRPKSISELREVLVTGRQFIKRDIIDRLCRRFGKSLELRSMNREASTLKFKSFIAT